MEMLFEVLGGDIAGVVVDVAGALQFPFEIEQGKGSDLAAAIAHLGSKDVGALRDRTAGLQRLDQKNVLRGGVRDLAGLGVGAKTLGEAVGGEDGLQVGGFV
jgi:hypothetical protein